MKHGKKPTTKQCRLMEEWRLKPTDWLVVKDTSTELVVVHRMSDRTVRTIPKEV